MATVCGTSLALMDAGVRLRDPARIDIRGELRSILLRVPSLPAVAWEGRDFVPTARTAWIRERLAWLPAELVTTGGEYGTVSERGLYLLDLFAARDATTSAIDQLADAIRAAFKAIQDGMQVAVLAPTTLLATQHGNTFADRFAGYPIRVEVLSRFLTAKEAKSASHNHFCTGRPRLGPWAMRVGMSVVSKVK